MNPGIGNSRLRAQRVIGQQLSSPEETVRWMGALQAQDYGQALWAIGVRTKGATRASIEKSIADVKILRTWPMRGTIHFVPPEDAKWMVQLTAERMIRADGYRQQQLGLNQHIIEKCRQLFIEAMKGGKRVSRPALMEIMEKAGVRTEGQRGYHILWSIAQTGTTCLGPLEGKQQTFMLLDECVPKHTRLTRDEALAELAKRYFTSHGPATVADFAGWTNMTLADAKLGLEHAKRHLSPETIDGQEYWQGRDSKSSPDSTEVLLLPGFDEFMLGYKNRNAILATDDATKVVPGKNGIFLPIMVLNGQIIGTWRRVIKPKKVDITLHPFTRLTKVVEGQALQAAQEYSTFLGLPIGSAKVEE
jgi:hypothetical protein